MFRFDYSTSKCAIVILCFIYVSGSVFEYNQVVKMQYYLCLASMPEYRLLSLSVANDD